MGSILEINDTLQLTLEQGFPAELDHKRHQSKPFAAQDFEGRVFEFRNKPKIRVYQAPPVRNFLVQNLGGKWLYWGLVHVLEVRHDYQAQTTSGTFKILHLYPPEDMAKAHQLIDRDKETDFFSQNDSNRP